MKRSLLLGFILIFVAYLMTGVFQVAPGEWALVRRCGQPQAELRGPGLHWGLPWGFDQVDRVTVDEQRQFTIGYLEETGPGDSLAPVNVSTPTGQALTGDQQMVNLKLSVQYRIDRSHILDYVLARPTLEEILSRTTEETMTVALAGERIDEVLLGRSALLETRLKAKLALRLQNYKTGVVIDSVSLVYAQPPQELTEAFRDVNRARAQRDISWTEANARKQADVSLARQDAERTVAWGTARARARLAQAHSEAYAFRTLLGSFPAQEPGASAALLQLYLSEMQSILGRMQLRTLSDQGIEQVVIVPMPPGK